MTGNPPDPGHAISMAKDTTYSYSASAGYFSKDGSMWGINEAGDLATSTQGALRIYQDAKNKLAESTSQSGTTFYVGTAGYQLLIENGQAVATSV